MRWNLGKPPHGDFHETPLNNGVSHHISSPTLKGYSIHSLVLIATASLRTPSQRFAKNRPNRFFDTLYCAQSALSVSQNCNPRFLVLRPVGLAENPEVFVKARGRTEVQPLPLDYFKAARPISIARLHGLLRFHLRPINDVVYIGSLGGLKAPRDVSS